MLLRHCTNISRRTVYTNSASKIAEVFQMPRHHWNMARDDMIQFPYHLEPRAIELYSWSCVLSAGSIPEIPIRRRT
jgi:hypothetical protein